MITRLQLANFKSFNELSIPLTRRNLLVGPNMSGKSNLIAAFRFLSLLVRGAGGRGLTNAFNTLAPGGVEELLWRGGQSRVMSLVVTGDFREFPDHSESDTWDYKIDIVAPPHGSPRIEGESLDVRTPTGQTSLIAKDPATGERVLQNIRNTQVHRFVDVEKSALEFEIPGWEGNSLTNLFRSFQFFTLAPAAMKQVNAASAVMSLASDGSNLSSWLMFLQTRFRDSFQAIEQATKDALPDVASILTWPTQQATVFVASAEHHLRTPVPVWQMSDGELCFIALVSLILGPEELGSPLYCLEEPENHLHPKLLQTLIGVLEQRQRSLGNKAAQIIATTHSLELVDRCEVQDLVVVEKRNGSSHCIRPSEKLEVQELLAREELGLGDLYYSGVLSR